MIEPGDPRLWWTLSDEISSRELRDRCFDPSDHQLRYLEAVAVGAQRDLSDHELAGIDLFVDGERNPELVPLWVAFHVFSSQGGDRTRIFTARSQLHRFGISVGGQDQILAAVSNLEAEAQLSLVSDPRALETTTLASMEGLQGSLPRDDWRGLRRLLFELVAPSVSVVGRNDEDFLLLTKPVVEIDYADNGSVSFADVAVSEGVMWYFCRGECEFVDGGFLTVGCHLTDEHEPPVELSPPYRFGEIEHKDDAWFSGGVHATNHLQKVTCFGTSTGRMDHPACINDRGYAYRGWTAGRASRGFAGGNLELFEAVWIDEPQVECREVQPQHEIGGTVSGLVGEQEFWVRIKAWNEQDELESNRTKRATASDPTFLAGNDYRQGWTYEMVPISSPPGAECLIAGHGTGRIQTVESDVDAQVLCGSAEPLPLCVEGELPNGASIGVRATTMVDGEVSGQTSDSFSPPVCSQMSMHRAPAGATWTLELEGANQELCEIVVGSGTYGSGESGELSCRSENCGPGGTSTPGGPCEYPVTVDFGIEPGTGPVDVDLELWLVEGGDTQSRWDVIPGLTGATQQTFLRALPNGTSYVVRPRVVAPEDLLCDNPAPGTIQNAPGFVSLGCGIASEPTSDFCHIDPELCILGDPDLFCTISVIESTIPTIVTTENCTGQDPMTENCGFFSAPDTRIQTLRVDCWTFGFSLLAPPTSPAMQAGQGVATEPESVSFAGPTVYLRTRTNRPLHPAEGYLKIHGVARDDQFGVSTVRVWVDGQLTPLESFEFGLTDATTCSEIPAPGCRSDSTFSGYLDLASLSDGLHSVVVVADSGGGPLASGADGFDFVVDRGATPPHCQGDTTAPVATIQRPLEGQVVEPNANGRITLDTWVADPAEVEKVSFYVDNLWVWDDETDPFVHNWLASAGEHTVKAAAFDDCGNWAWTENTVTFTVGTGDGGGGGGPCGNDVAGPTVVVSGPADGAVVTPNANGRVALQGVASDSSGVDRLEFFIDGVEVWTDSTSPYAHNWPSSAGSHDFKLRAIDACGNASFSEEITFTVDSGSGGGSCSSDAQGPSASVLRPTAGSVVTPNANGRVTLEAAASDGSGIDRVEFFIDGQEVWSDATSPYSHNWPASAGPHDFKVRAVDGCGNATFSSEVTFTVEGDGGGGGGGSCADDASGPTMGILRPADGETVTPNGNGRVTLEASATDAGGVDLVELYVDGGLVHSDETSPYAHNWLASAGQHELAAKGFDACGNQAWSSAVVFTVEGSSGGGCASDSTPPAVGVSSPLNQSTVSPGSDGTVPLAAVASDNSGIAKVDFLIDGSWVGSDTAAPYGVSWSASAGSHELRVKASDTCGNVRWSSPVEFTVPAPDPCLADGTGPTLTITHPTAGLVIEGDDNVVLLEATASDPSGVDRVEFSVDGVWQQGFVSPPFSFFWEREVGPHTFDAVARDGCGNESSASVSFTVSPPSDDPDEPDF
ncbi:MAG: Ig-like domain-containing protein [Acidobacteriota bacterium]